MPTSTRIIFRRLLAGTVIGSAMLIVQPAMAIAGDATVQLSIPAQGLSAALNALAQQSRKQLVVDGSLTRGRQITPLRGAYTLGDALRTMLRGTGLSFRIEKDTVIVYRGDRLAAAAGYIPTAITQAGVAASVAEAGTSAPQDEPAEIVVTGSRIARGAYDQPTPVASFDAEKIEQSGFSNVSDILMRSPEVGVGLGQANSYYNADAGAAFVNLRGLGTNRTLVLVNGRRRVSGTQLSSAVDLSTIPANMIGKMEVITGGAAAVYGADAVTGVVNVTLKDNVEGLELSGRSGISSRGDAGSYTLGAILGGKIAEDRGSFIIGASYNKEALLRANERSFGRKQVTLIGNPANTGPADGIFNNISVTDYRYPNTSYGGAFMIGNTRYTYGPGGVRPTQNDELVTPSVGIGGDGFNDADFAPLRNKSEVFAAMAHLDYRFGEKLKLFVDAQYAKTKTDALLQPSFDSGRILTIDNPLIPSDVRALMAANNQTTLSVGRTNIDQGINHRLIDRETITGVVGLEGELGSRFKWLAFYQYGRYDADTARTHGRIQSKFLQAIDVVSGPNGPVCRSGAAGCVPLSLFGPDAATPEALSYFDYTARRSLRNTQEVAGLQLTGSAFDLPAGPVQIAAGAEYRRESLRAIADPRAAAGELHNITDASADASFNVKEVFGEVLVPLLRNVPFARDLSVEGAVRYSDYSNIGSTVAWKLGGQWAPVDDLRVRVTRSRSVRAPNLSELYNPGSQAGNFLIDPCDATQRNLTTNRAANCTALGLPATFVDPFGNVAKQVVTSGNPNLREEVSTSWTAGAVLTPRFLPGFAASIDWWKIDLKGAISSVPLQRILDNCVDSASISNPFCSVITRNAEGGIALVQAVPLNVGSLKAEGIDFQASYRHGLGGSVQGRLAFASTLLLKNELQVVANDPTTLDLNKGEVDNPTFRFNLTPGISVGPLTLDWTVRYISATKADMQAGVEGRDDNDVKSRLYNDLYASVEVARNFRLYAGINNLFDVDPPFGALTYQGTGRGALYDNIGRYFFIGVNTKFN